jgi:serine/threonine protein phosphatase PrpC
MSDLKDVVTKLFKSNTISVPAHRKELFDRFLQDEVNKTAIQEIIENQNSLMARWKVEDRIADIVQQPIRLLNGTIGKPYETRIDFDALKWNDLASFHFDGLEESGLQFDDKAKLIIGVPTKSGDIKLHFKFRVEGQPEDAPFADKPLLLIVNPDPKTLWKNIESDRKDPYWKEDNVTLLTPLNDRHLLVSSKRGRSHANVGSYREDDFSFSDLDNGWSIVVVADGAGSAKLSRKGSSIACLAVVEYFKSTASVQAMQAFDKLIREHKANLNETTDKSIKRFLYDNLATAAFHAHKQLEEFAGKTGVALKDLSTTLIFTLLKKYDIGYALLSFGVGDCPMAVICKSLSRVINLNWIDVGEFGGGTRFITMPEIFKNTKFATRLNFQLVDDFSYLFLMSDGIYDAKFVVEANLTDIKKWQLFLEDLQGANEDKIVVELDPQNKDVVTQFSSWMDFWSPGNHDDRTLAIVF